MNHDDYFQNIKIAPERLAGLKHILADVPEEEREEAACRFVRYLQLVIAIVDEASESRRSEPAVPPEVAKPAAACPSCGRVLQ